MILWPQLSKCLRTHIKKLNRAAGKDDDEMIDSVQVGEKISCMACLLCDSVALVKVQRCDVKLSRSGSRFGAHLEVIVSWRLVPIHKSTSLQREPLGQKLTHFHGIDGRRSRRQPLSRTH